MAAGKHRRQQFTGPKKITITTAGTSTPTNYQIKVTVAYESAMQATFADIRFKTKAGVNIDYWIESKTDGVTADVWLELPDAITDPGSDYIWMYYGNPALSGASNIGNTFLFGDDFSGDLSKWGFNIPANWEITDGVLNHIPTTDEFGKALFDAPTNFIIEGNVKTPTAGVQQFMFLSGRHPDDYSVAGNDVAFGLAIFPGTTEGYNIYSAGWVSGAHTIIADQLYKIKGIFNGTNVDLYVDYPDADYIFRVNATTALEYTKVGIHAGFVANIKYDNIRVRKYIANEPTVAVGTAQLLRRTSHMHRHYPK